MKTCSTKIEKELYRRQEKACLLPLDEPDTCSVRPYSTENFL